MEITNEIKIIFWMGSFIMLFLIVAFFSMALFYQRSFAKAKRKEAELLLKTSLESEKKERARIAKDLHDCVQGDLNAIRNYFLVYTRNKDHEDSGELFDEIVEALDQTITSARLISHKLMPPLLEKRGLIVAVQNYFLILNKSAPPTFNIHDKTTTMSVPLNDAYELFRVFQEFTSNMLKYGKINECHIYLHQQQNKLVFEIIDDGQSFNFKENYLIAKGLGLQNIQSRLNSINAKLEQKNVATGNHFVIYLN